MGRDSYFVCKDCKKRYHLGYGCYSTWLDCVHTIPELIHHPFGYDKNKSLRKNVNLEHCLKEHENHDVLTYSSDWDHEIEGIKEYEKYKLIDLWGKGAGE